MDVIPIFFFVSFNIIVTISIPHYRLSLHLFLKQTSLVSLVICKQKFVLNKISFQTNLELQMYIFLFVIYPLIFYFVIKIEEETKNEILLTFGDVKR